MSFNLRSNRKYGGETYGEGRLWRERVWDKGRGCFNLRVDVFSAEQVWGGRFYHEGHTTRRWLSFRVPAKPIGWLHHRFFDLRDTCTRFHRNILLLRWTEESLNKGLLVNKYGEFRHHCIHRWYILTLLLLFEVSKNICNYSSKYPAHWNEIVIPYKFRENTRIINTREQWSRKKIFAHFLVHRSNFGNIKTRTTIYAWANPNQRSSWIQIPGLINGKK